VCVGMDVWRFGGFVSTDEGALEVMRRRGLEIV